MTVPARRPVDPVLGALDRLDELVGALYDRKPIENEYRDALATVRSELERLREERDEWERKAPVWTAQAVEPWQRRAEVTEVENQRLTEGLREISRIAVNGDDHAIPDPLARLDAIESVARALLSANPPQGDTAAFCEHGYTTEDSAHPSAGLERCPTCSPSDGGGA